MKKEQEKKNQHGTGRLNILYLVLSCTKLRGLTFAPQMIVGFSMRPWAVKASGKKCRPLIQSRNTCKGGFKMRV